MKTNRILKKFERALYAYMIKEAIFLILLAGVFLGFKAPTSGPTYQPTTIPFSNRTVNSMVVSFTNAVGTPNGSLLIYSTRAPVARAASSIDSTSFVAKWSVVNGSSGYRIDVSIDTFSTFISGFNNLAVAGTTVSVTGLSGGTTYQYQVRAESNTGTSANSNPVSVLTVPYAPVPFSCTRVTTTSFSADWHISTGATDYFLDVSTDINFGSFVLVFNNYQATGTNSAAITGLAGGTIYYYRVRAQNAAGTSGNSGTITQITVPAIPVTLNASNEQSDNFIANWTEVEGADSYELDVTLSSSNFSTFVTIYDGRIIPDAAQTQEVVTGLASNTIYKYRLRARNAGGVSGNSSSKSVLTLLPGGGTVQPPTITVTASTDSDIKAQSSNGFNPSTNTITFLHRKITDIKFTSEPDITGSTADIIVNAAWLDQMGMEYFFRVKDEAEKKDSTNNQFIYLQVSNVNLSTQSDFVPGGTSESYRIFSIPLDFSLSSDRIEDIFQPIEAQYGGIDKTKWRLVHYQAVQNGGQNINYGAGLTTIDQGKSYWFNSIDPPHAIIVSGSVTQANQAKGFIMSLDAGFTQIGNPYPFNISWGDVLAQNANVPGISGVGSLYTYDPQHVTFNKDAAILNAWGGGFVHSNAPIQLTIPVTIKQGRIGAAESNDIKTRSIDQSQWFVPIKISQGITYNNYSGPGMHLDARQGYDRFDDFTPPRFANYLEMNSYHPDYHTQKFSRDIVPTDTHYNWDFDVESNFDEHEAVMTWDNQSLGDNAAQLLLYDLAANMIVDMKKVGSYRFEIREKHPFRIFFGVDEKSLSPDINCLGRAYPNPFAQSATIPFITSVDRPDVQIAMYDMMGRKIREMVNGRFEPGYHEGVWDGADDQGGRAAQGVYIYRLTSTNMPAQMGRVVLK